MSVCTDNAFDALREPTVEPTTDWATVEEEEKVTLKPKPKPKPRQSHVCGVKGCFKKVDQANTLCRVHWKYKPHCTVCFRHISQKAMRDHGGSAPDDVFHTHNDCLKNCTVEGCEVPVRDTQNVCLVHRVKGQGTGHECRDCGAMEVHYGACMECVTFKECDVPCCNKVVAKPFSLCFHHFNKDPRCRFCTQRLQEDEVGMCEYCQPETGES